jgi:streptogramin lyase
MVSRIDSRTKHVTYWDPWKIKINSIPENSTLGWGIIPGTSFRVNKSVAGLELNGLQSLGADEVPLDVYHVSADSKGIAWYTSLSTGWLVRLDPHTGLQTPFKDPEVPGSRGNLIDANDNIWFGNWGGRGGLVEFDQRTNHTHHYPFPTEHAMVYSLTADDKNGNIWAADYNGNQLTRFNIATGKITEFPLPTRRSYLRFISADKDGNIWYGAWWQSKVGLLVPGGRASGATTAKNTHGNSG